MIILQKLFATEVSNSASTVSKYGEIDENIDALVNRLSNDPNVTQDTNMIKRKGM